MSLIDQVITELGATTPKEMGHECGHGQGWRQVDGPLASRLVELTRDGGPGCPEEQVYAGRIDPACD